MSDNDELHLKLICSTACQANYDQCRAALARLDDRRCHLLAHIVADWFATITEDLDDDSTGFDW